MAGLNLGQPKPLAINLFIGNFAKALRKIQVDTLIIGGFNRVECVYKTTKGALKRNYNVITSDQIMFGQTPYDEEDRIRDILEWYKSKTVYFEDIIKLIKEAKK